MRRGVERPTPRRLTPDLLRELVAPRPGPLVSVYLAIQGAFPEARQNAVLLRQAVEALESRLAELGVAPDQISR